MPDCFLQGIGIPLMPVLQFQYRWSFLTPSPFPRALATSGNYWSGCQSQFAGCASRFRFARSGHGLWGSLCPSPDNRNISLLFSNALKCHRILKCKICFAVYWEMHSRVPSIRTYTFYGIGWICGEFSIVKIRHDYSTTRYVFVSSNPVLNTPALVKSHWWSCWDTIP